jgi:DNA-binding MarR family transcriptional regulator
MWRFEAVVKHISKAEYETLASFRYLLRQFLQFSEDAARQLGLPPQQYQALLAIKGFPRRDSITVGELAERLHIRHHSAVGLVDRMEAQGLVAREQGQDRRQVQVKLTAQGGQFLGQLAATHREELRRIGPALSAILERLSENEE